jgi:hypothetical protein
VTTPIHLYAHINATALLGGISHTHNLRLYRQRFVASTSSPCRLFLDLPALKATLKAWHKAKRCALVEPWRYIILWRKTSTAVAVVAPTALQHHKISSQEKVSQWQCLLLIIHLPPLRRDKGCFTTSYWSDCSEINHYHLVCLVHHDSGQLLSRSQTTGSTRIEGRCFWVVSMRKVCRLA